MPKVTVRAWVSGELKEEAEMIFAAIGTTTMQAVGEIDGGRQSFQTTDKLFADWKP
jgi:hypothetical protein